LPHGFLCYRPLAGAPEVAASSCERNGYVTFGSFNNLAKMTPQVVTTWAAILKQLPDARLLLKTRSFSDPGARERYQAQFDEAGIDQARVELRGPAYAIPEHLAMYGEVDIALDTFPYNGTTTTCEALWMGVPVITLAGRVHAGRVGVSLLTQVGLDDYVAENTEAYIAKAVQLAEQIRREQRPREALRERMSKSPLCQAQVFTRALEDVYRELWHNWCMNTAGGQEHES